MYATKFIIRFAGTLKTGPNAGKSYEFSTSWSGISFETAEAAAMKLAVYQAREPQLVYKVCARTYNVKGEFNEIDVAI